MKTQLKIQKNPEQALKKQKRIRTILIVCLILVLIPISSAALGVAGFSIWATTQNVDASLLPTATAISVYYDTNGNPLPSEEDVFVNADSLTENLKNAFVAIEDKRFYSHKGYDSYRMASAVIKNLKAGTVREGASTITQQLVKNTHLSQERTLSRKLKELAIAIQLEKQYDKDEILAMYLSVIYFGGSAYGVKQAANTYFGKSIDELSLAECATLAGIVKNPAGYSPINNPGASVKRRNLVLSFMLAQNYIDKDEYTVAVESPIVTADNSALSHDGTISAKSCEFYISQAQKEVCDALGMTKYQLNNSGLKIYTNLDTTLQQELEIQRMSANNYESEDIGSVSIVLNNETCAVLAYSSSYPYTISRQTGSVLKPLAVYAPALDKGLISLATPIVDEKINFGGYSPNNFGGVYYGDTTVREAIKKSMNSVSVKVIDYLGTDISAAYLASIGIDIDDSDRSYALALGATQNGVSPLAVAGGYSTLARGGDYIKPSFVKYIVDGGRKTYFGISDDESGWHSDTLQPNGLKPHTQKSTSVFSKAASELITSALIDTVKDGTAKTLGALPFAVASKTGTAERSDKNNSDAWNVSYNCQYTVLVWHGSDGMMSERGGGYPTRHALNIWKAIDRLKSVARKFSTFESVISQEIDTYSSKLSKKVVASTQNTPLEYRKTELFATDKLPDSSGSKFDTLQPATMKIENSSGRISITFNSENIYVYELYRNDVTGTKRLLSEIGNGGEITVYDRPIAFDGKVDYTLICYLKNNEEMSATSHKSVYIKDTNFNL